MRQRLIRNLHSSLARFINKTAVTGGGGGGGQAGAPLTNVGFDSWYTVTVAVGTNGQVFDVLLDTGSSDTWFKDPACQSSDNSCTGFKLRTNDPSLTPLGTTFSDSYGFAYVSGVVYQADISVSGVSALTSFGSARNAGGFSGINGVLGLGYAALNDMDGGNWFDNMGFNSTQYVFGIYLSNSINKDVGELTIGGYDSTKFVGPITYISLSYVAWWSFTFKGAKFTVGSSSPKDAAGSNTDAIADTGTTMIILDTIPANTINAAIGAGSYSSTDGVYPINCGIAKTGPMLNLTFGGGTFSIPASTCKIFFRQVSQVKER
ncbi:hypothetical protein HDU76_009136 [Blyttiomyces sp. JEL0837]|nr:hypothetical protein HDU76_009136 [Blyttiomyces sp. JEL0837]